MSLLLGNVLKLVVNWKARARNLYANDPVRSRPVAALMCLAEIVQITEAIWASQEFPYSACCWNDSACLTGFWFCFSISGNRGQKTQSCVININEVHVVCNVWQHQTAGACIINFDMVCVLQLSHKLLCIPKRCNLTRQRDCWDCKLLSSKSIHPSIQKLQSETFIPKASIAWPVSTV